MSATAKTIHPTGVNLQRFHIARDVLHDREIDKALGWQIKDFVLFSSNMRLCLPEVPISRHWTYYMNLLCYRDLLLKEHNNCETIDTLFDADSDSSTNYTGPLPAIFSSFHFGSYRSIVGVLVHQRIDFVMVVNEALYHKEEQRIRETVRKVQAALGTDIFFDILNAEAPSAAMKMSAYLLKNISIAVFVDGNTGVGGAYRKDQQLARIGFFDQPIYVRRGVGVLSKITRKPIVPLVLHYPDNDSLAPVVNFHAPIHFDKERKDYVDYAMRKVYQVLEEHVKARPDQWQGWLYFHKFLDIDSLREAMLETRSEDPVMQDCTRFNEQRYSLFKMDENGFLFDRYTYKTYPLDTAFFDQLAKTKKEAYHPSEVKYYFGEETSQVLWSREILTTTPSHQTT